MKPKLHFYFGFEGSKAKAAGKLFSKTKPAFAFKTKFDPESMNWEGFIWFARDRKDVNLGLSFLARPDFWSTDPALYNVILHELGHIFGLEHIDGTPMDRAVPAFAIRFAGTPGSRKLSSRELLKYAIGFDFGPTRSCFALSSDFERRKFNRGTVCIDSSNSGKLSFQVKDDTGKNIQNFQFNETLDGEDERATYVEIGGNYLLGKSAPVRHSFAKIPVRIHMKGIIEIDGKRFAAFLRSGDFKSNRYELTYVEGEVTHSMIFE